MTEPLTGEQAVARVLGSMNRLRFHLDVHSPIDDDLVHDTLRELVEAVLTLALHMPYRTGPAPMPDFLRPPREP